MHSTLPADCPGSASSRQRSAPAARRRRPAGPVSRGRGARFGWRHLSRRRRWPAFQHTIAGCFWQRAHGPLPQPGCSSGCRCGCCRGRCRRWCDRGCHGGALATLCLSAAKLHTLWLRSHRRLLPPAAARGLLLPPSAGRCCPRLPAAAAPELLASVTLLLPLPGCFCNSAAVLLIPGLCHVHHQCVCQRLPKLAWGLLLWVLLPPLDPFTPIVPLMP